MTKTRPAYEGASDLDTTALTDGPFEFDSPILTTITFPIPDGAEDSLTEKPLLLRLEREVVECCFPFDLSTGVSKYFFVGNWLQCYHLPAEPGPDASTAQQPVPATYCIRRRVVQGRPLF